MREHPDWQRKVASKGGKAAHAKGTAHEWTTAEAKKAGSKGGIECQRRRRVAALRDAEFV